MITTTYIGATEREALDRLVRDFGAEVKIQYDAQRTRLHAKAWLFRRETPASTRRTSDRRICPVRRCSKGSSGTSGSSRVATPTPAGQVPRHLRHLLERPEFESYDPERDRDRLDDALARGRARKAHDRVTICLSGLEVRPYPYQAGDARRDRGRTRRPRPSPQSRGRGHRDRQDRHRCPRLSPDLVRGHGSRPRPACSSSPTDARSSSSRCGPTARCWPTATSVSCTSAGTRPERWKHVFASVQSLTSYGVTNIPPDALRDRGHRRVPPRRRPRPTGGSWITSSP